MLLRSLIISHPLWSLFGLSTGAAYLRSLWSKYLLYPTIEASLPDNPDLLAQNQVLLKYQASYGYNPHSLVSILPEARVWVDPAKRGAVCYLPIGNTWLATDPFVPEEHLLEVTQQFLKAAQAAKCLVGFVPATSRLAKIAPELGLDAMPIGVSPYFDLKTWAPRGDKAKKVRAGINQARRAGLTVEAISGKALSAYEVKELCDSWINTRRSIGFGWLFSLEPLRFSEHKRFFTARNSEGKMMGLLAASPIPARNGWYLEDILRHPDAPAGTSDLLIVDGLKDLALLGSSMATLGTIPAAHMEMGLSLSRGRHKLAYNLLHHFGKRMEVVYNFQGLRRFKAKFAPTWWESEYALFPPGFTHVSRITIAALRAIAPTGIWQAIRHSLGNSQ